MKFKGILYISYDGMLEPLGQSQVIAYLERLAADYVIHLVSFEKAADWADTARRDAIAARLDAAGIRWYPRRYHKRPSTLATAWDIVVGTCTGLWLAVCHHVRIAHARSDVPGVMALTVKKLTGAKFIFDMRAFWADERVDGGLWPRGGCLYRVAKWVERRLLLNADHAVSLTHAAVREMEKFDFLKGRMPPVTIITTCADLTRFRPLPRPVNAGTAFTMGYVGSAGTWYLFDEVIAAFVVLRKLRSDARLLIVNRNEHAYIRQRLQAAGVPMDFAELRTADHAGVPELMARMDVGVFFYKPSYSRAACAPTKLGEFLGCGIPCLANAGVGDMAEILEEGRVGVAVAALDESSLRVGVQRLLELQAEPGIQARCVAAARRHFVLEDGVESYRRIYERLVS